MNENYKYDDLTVETEKRLAIPLALADGWEPYNNYLSFT